MADNTTPTPEAPPKVKPLSYKEAGLVKDLTGKPLKPDSKLAKAVEAAATDLKVEPIISTVDNPRAWNLTAPEALAKRVGDNAAAVKQGQQVANKIHRNITRGIASEQNPSFLTKDVLERAFEARAGRQRSGVAEGMPKSTSGITADRDAKTFIAGPKLREARANLKALPEGHADIEAAQTAVEEASKEFKRIQKHLKGRDGYKEYLQDSRKVFSDSIAAERATARIEESAKSAFEQAATEAKNTKLTGLAAHSTELSKDAAAIQKHTGKLTNAGQTIKGAVGNMSRTKKIGAVVIVAAAVVTLGALIHRGKKHALDVQVQRQDAQSKGAEPGLAPA